MPPVLVGVLYLLTVRDRALKLTSMHHERSPHPGSKNNRQKAALFYHIHPCPYRPERIEDCHGLPAGTQEECPDPKKLNLAPMGARCVAHGDWYQALRVVQTGTQNA